MDAGGFNRSHILDMLNVKYVITNKKHPSHIDGLCLDSLFHL